MNISTCEFSDPTSIKIIDSKRAGYIELIGNLVAENDNGDKLNITCNEGIYDKINIVLKKENLKILIEEKDDGITVDLIHSGVQKRFPYPFQSQLSLRYFIELLEGKPSLTAYNEASLEHLSFLHAIKNLISATNNERIWKIT